MSKYASKIQAQFSSRAWTNATLIISHITYTTCVCTRGPWVFRILLQSHVGQGKVWCSYYHLYYCHHYSCLPPCWRVELCDGRGEHKGSRATWVRVTIYNSLRNLQPNPLLSRLAVCLCRCWKMGAMLNKICIVHPFLCTNGRERETNSIHILHFSALSFSISLCPSRQPLALVNPKQPKFDWICFKTFPK